MGTPYIYSFTEPVNAEELSDLLKQTHWANKRSPLDVQKTLDRSQLTLGVWDDERLIGFSRVVTDDIYRAVIDDVVVDNAYREQGVATTMLEKLLMRLQHIEIVMLDCAPNLCGFYARLGFVEKTDTSMMLIRER